MTISNDSDENLEDGKSEASLFEAISHDTRIRTLFLLHDYTLGFSELKHKLKLSSSGNLQHHIGKLGTLIHLNENGLYALTDHGKEAILAIQAVRRVQNRKQSDRIIITMVYAFSLYAAFMNVPFFMGTVNANTPIMALEITVIGGIIFYMGWPFVVSRYERKQAESKS